MNTFKLRTIENVNDYVEVTFNFIEKNKCYDISLTYNYSSELNTLEKKKNFYE